eukprot:9395406-Pyramimonas_sp.AAC.1
MMNKRGGPVTLAWSAWSLYPPPVIRSERWEGAGMVNLEVAVSNHRLTVLPTTQARAYSLAGRRGRWRYSDGGQKTLVTRGPFSALRAF